MVLTAGMSVTPADLEGQQRLLGVRTTAIVPIFESWTFGDGLPQRVGGDSVLVKSVTQWSMPVSVMVPLGSRWTVDASAAYAMGEVSLEGADPSLGLDSYALAGPTDARVRLVGRLVGDNVLVTVGANAPTGTVSLGREELAALRVLAAPALRLQTPGLGRGAGGTAGLVLARQISQWAFALGISYEITGNYSPVAAVTAGTASPDLDPGDALHLSLGADGLIGQHAMTLAVSLDTYGPDDLRFPNASGEGARTEVRLGPTLTAEWEFRVAAPWVRELTLYATDRYRSKYEQDGIAVEGSSGNQADAGLRLVLPAGRSVGILVGLDARHHTGLKVDNSLATAAMAGGGATLGLEIGGGRLVVHPFGRVQIGTIDTGGIKSDARGISGGLSIGTRF
jgi:hypothetical protein